MKLLNLMLATLVLLSVGACGNKNKDNGKNDKTVEDINYSIEGIADITIPANEKTEQELTVTYISGTQEAVSIAIAGMPEKVTAELSKDNGLPDYTSELSIKSDMAEPGEYPLTITATSKSGIVKTFNFTLTITPFIDCGAELAGTYAAYKSCNSGSDDDIEVIIEQKEGSDKDIFIKYEENNIPATIDCQAGTITIPEYVKEGEFDGSPTTLTIKGDGTFDSGTITISVNEVFKIQPSYESNVICTITMQR